MGCGRIWPKLGIVAAQAREGLKQSLAIIADEGDERAPRGARANLIQLAAQLQALQTVIGSIEKRLVVQHRANVASKRLDGMRLRRCVEELQG